MSIITESSVGQDWKTFQACISWDTSYIFLIPGPRVFIRDSGRQGEVSVEFGVSGAWASLKLSACVLGLCELALWPPLPCGGHTLL